MVEIKKSKTTTVEVDSEDFKIVVKKIIFWQREKGYFKDDVEKEFKEYEWRKENYFCGHRTDFEFSNGINKSLIILNFLPILVPVEEGIEEHGSHREFINLICQVENGKYDLVCNEQSIICVHNEEH
jgi:hypothetical protein